MNVLMKGEKEAHTLLKSAKFVSENKQFKEYYSFYNSSLIGIESEGYLDYASAIEGQDYFDFLLHLSSCLGC